MVIVERLSKAYTQHQKVLNHLFFEVNPGEIHVLFGRSGSGKSTFLNCLSGVISPDSGRVRVLEKDLSGSFVCEGVIFGPTGTVNSRFVADMIIEWDKGKGILNERFTYDTGVVQDRKWELQVSSSGDIRGIATDFVGDAT